MPNDSGRTAVRVRISGQVQGVWFRAWISKRAVDLDLDGWVRNRSDGTVEALFAGPQPAVERMVTDCRDGPSAASVSEVITGLTSETVTPGSGFETLPTV
tara:strand:- start:581 stop:880 length:300 start_codon:yes stop_codon:yes gene_type:complete